MRFLHLSFANDSAENCQFTGGAKVILASFIWLINLNSIKAEIFLPFRYYRHGYSWLTDTNTCHYFLGIRLGNSMDIMVMFVMLVAFWSILKELSDK